MKTNLRAARNLRLRLTDGGGLRASISRSSGEFELTLEVLELLSLLNSGKSEPRTLAKALRGRLQACLQNAPDAEEIEQLLEDLRGAGVVAGGNRADPASASGLEDGFGDAWIQWAMIADAPRTRTYCEAIAAAVTPESVVVDVGAGTGVLTAAALRAGASKVVAIEETASARTIEPFLKRMGLLSAQRFELFQGNSGDATIPSNVNLVVSELFGNDPFSEGVLQTLSELAARLPKGKGVRFIPESVEIFAELIDLQGGPLLHRVRAWVQASGKSRNGKEKSDYYSSMADALCGVLDFSSLSFAHALSPTDFLASSQPVSLGRVSLSPPPPLTVKILTGQRPLLVSRETTIPMVMLWFRVVLAPGLTLSSRPGEGDACEHWSPILVPLCTFLKSQAKLDIAFSLSETHDRIELRVTQGHDVLGSRI
jgi:hypothetical protein